MNAVLGRMRERDIGQEQAIDELTRAAELVASAEAAWRAAAEAGRDARARRNQAIRDAIADGLSQAEIARLVGLTSSRVAQIAPKPRARPARR